MVKFSVIEEKIKKCKFGHGKKVRISDRDLTREYVSIEKNICCGISHIY